METTNCFERFIERTKKLSKINFYENEESTMFVKTKINGMN